jgi:exosortase
MPTTASQSAPAAPPAFAGLSRHAWIRIGFLAALFLLLHGWAFQINAQVAGSNSNWSHVFLVPFISLYLVWQQWDDLRGTPARTCWWGLPAFVLGVFMYLMLLELGRATPLAFFTIFNLGALALFLAGRRVFVKLAIPIVYLFFAVPTDLLIQPISNKLQMLAAGGANVLINAIGLFLDVQADRLGTTLQICRAGVPLDPPLNIAEACSGLRMLMAFAALGTAMAYLMKEKPRWIRVTLMLSTVPIAVLANVLRITGMGLVYPWYPGVADGDLHGMLGLLMLVPAIGLFLLLEWLLVRMWIPAGGDTPAAGKRSSRAAPAPTAAMVTGRVFTLPAMVAAGIMAGAILYSGYLILLAPPDPIRGKQGWLVSTAEIPTRRPLPDFPATLGPYVKVSEERLDAETERNLGTTNYIVWTYRDSRTPAGAPPVGIRFQFAYWSGTKQILSTGVHYPELCYTSSGAKTVDARTVKLQPGAGMAPVPLRLFQFAAPGGSVSCVGYFFIMNGRRTASADFLRIATFLGPTRNLYYCKVECMPCVLRKDTAGGKVEAASGVADPEEAQALIRDFLKQAIPEVEKTLPGP